MRLESVSCGGRKFCSILLVTGATHLDTGNPGQRVGTSARLKFACEQRFLLHSALLVDFCIFRVTSLAVSVSNVVLVRPLLLWL